VWQARRHRECECDENLLHSYPLVDAVYESIMVLDPCAPTERTERTLLIDQADGYLHLEDFAT